MVRYASRLGPCSQMLIKGTAGGGPEARRHIAAALCTVAGIAVTHVAATQAAQLCVLNGVPPFFSMWFSTGWNVLLALPLLRLGTAGTSVPRLVWQVLPFYALWAGANTMYVAALGSLTSSLTTALFSVTPALVVLLAVPLLRRRLTLLSVLACLLAAAGVALVAQPWSKASSGESAISLSGLAAVLGAAACAALYKVLFKRLFDDPPARSVLLVLALLGCWSLTMGTAILGGITAAAQGGVPAAVAALPALPWGFLCLKALFDLAFNFLIALGISLTHPLFISIGTILGTCAQIGATPAAHTATTHRDASCSLDRRPHPIPTLPPNRHAPQRAGGVAAAGLRPLACGGAAPPHARLGRSS